MAFLIIKDSHDEYQTRDLPSDMEENGALTVGSDASCDIVLPTGEGFAPVHCKVRWREGFWALRSVDGMIRVHGIEEQHVKLVEETNYHIGPHTMAYVQDDLPDDGDGDDTEEEEDKKDDGKPETDSKGEKKAITRKDIARSRKKRKLARKAGTAQMVSLAEQKKQSAAGGMLGTLYVLAVIVAAFIAGLTLRYFLLTGHYLPDKW
ncbi:MAG: FHA domain-containing protein [Akkermansia sp.]|nr:FHA domain-containing protein [Akkermansia sp.]